MAFVIILEVDNWVAFGVSKRDLGLTNDMFVVDFAGRSNMKDEIITGVLYGSIFAAKLGMIIWDIYHEIEHTLHVADNVGDPTH